MELLHEFVVNIPWYEVAWTVLLLGIVVGLMIYYRLTIVIESLVSFGRAFVQLILMAGVLLVFFRWDNLYLNIVLCLVMVGVAALTAAHESPQEGAFWISLFSQAVASAFTLIPMTLAGVIDLRASFFLPIAAMIIRNTLDRASLSFERLEREMKQNRDLVEQYLALGIEPAYATRDLVRQSIESSMIPTLNKLKVVGLVGLPGLMTGMILTAEAGTLTETLAYAATLQAILLYLIFASSILSSMMICLLMRTRYFNRRQQLRFSSDQPPEAEPSAA